MPKRSASRPRVVREPVQVYLAPDDSALLARLTDESGLSKAEILRRGMRGFALAQRGASPMLRFLREGIDGRWPAAVAVDHDAVLAGSYRAPARNAAKSLAGNAARKAGRTTALKTARKRR